MNNTIAWGELKTLVGAIFPCILALCLSIPGKEVIAQPLLSVDSLRQLFAQPSPDTLRISTIVSLQMGYALLADPPALLHYHSWADSICRARLQNPSGLSRKDKKYYTRSLGVSLERQAFYYQRQAWDAEKALQLHEESLVYSRAAGDLPTMGNALNNIANIFQDQGDIPTALEYYLKAREVWEQVSDKSGLAICLDDIGKLYTTQGDLPKAKEFTQLALEECRKGDFIGTEAMALMHLGNIYTLEGNFPAAETCLVQSLDIVQQFENYVLIALAHRYWGILLEAEGKTPEALEAHHRGLASAEKASYDKGISLAHLYISKIQYGQQHLADALFHASQSFQYAKQTGIVLNIKEAAEFLSRLHEESGDPVKALQYYKYSTVMKDSLFNENNRSSMIRQQMQYEFDKKEAIALREKKIQRIMLTAFAALLVFTSIFTAVIFRNLRSKERQNKIIEQQNKEMEHQNQQIVENSRVIQDQAEKLQRLDEMKSRFFTNISHEFRTPLTLVLGPLDDLITGNAKGNVLPLYQMIRRNAQRLLLLINQLLDLSRLESSEMKLEIRCEDIIGFLKGNFYAFESLAHHLKIRLHFATELETAPLYFDRHKMGQVIANVLSNAFKFTPEGGEVSLKIRNDGAFLKIEVADTGSGIPADQLSFVFDRFYQGSASGRKGSLGSGIGLALTKELVELHQGRIQVESKVGEGTQFTIFLPMGSAHFSPEEMVEDQADKKVSVDEPVLATGFVEVDGIIPPPFPESGTPKLLLPGSEEAMEEAIVLLVEDNADMRAFIRNQLDGPYRVIEATNGEEGVEKAFEYIPDLIVSDVMMPRMDGLQLCDILKNDDRTSHIPIILLTAKATTEDKITGLERGADAYLPKPFNRKELQVRVDKLVALRQQLQVYYAGRAASSLDQETLSEPGSALEKDVRIEDAFLKKVNEIIEEHLSEAEYEVPQLSRELGMSHSQLYRKIKALTGQSIAAYIRSYRLHQGRIMLQTSDLNVSEVAYFVGFTDPSYFSRMYLEAFGETPSEGRG